MNVPVALGAALIDVTYDKDCAYCGARAAREIVFAFEVRDDLSIANWVECLECGGGSWTS